MPKSLSNRIKEKALYLGFSACGIAKVETLHKESKQLESWLQKGMHGKMHYMENHFEKRVDPSLLVGNAKSVISVLLNYHQVEGHFSDEKYAVSQYAWGEDYHKVIKNKLYQLLKFIETNAGKVNARVFTDSAPVMDKVWAQKAGLGWIGKNTCLTRKKEGSWFFIGEIIIDIELEYDKPAKNFCGSCTKCIDACPTGALIEPYKLDATKCISYLTIELKDKIPGELRAKKGHWVFGCDICQQVCPWNRFAKPHHIKEFKPLVPGNLEDVVKEKQAFKKAFKRTAISRVKYEKFLDNLNATGKKSSE